MASNREFGPSGPLPAWLVAIGFLVVIALFSTGGLWVWLSVAR